MTVCHYTAKFSVKRFVGKPDQWGEPTPVQLDGESIGWDVKQAMDGTLYTYRRRSSSESIAPSLDAPYLFQNEWERERLKTVTLTIATTIDPEKLNSGKLERADIDELNRQASRVLFAEHPTPDDVCR